MSRLKKDLGTIQRAIQILAGTYDKDLLSFEIAHVTCVDTANWLCTAKLISGTTRNIYTHIQLTSEKASNGFIQVPKVGSNVILAITWRNEVYVFMCSEIDALVFHQLNADGKTYEEFVINCNSKFNPSLPLGIAVSDGGGNGVVITSGTATSTNSSGNNGITLTCGNGSVSNSDNGIVISNNNGNVTNAANGIIISNSGSPPSNNGNGILISCSGTMQLNGNSYDGLVEVIPLTNALQAIQTDINNLKSFLSSIVTATNIINTTFTGTPTTPAQYGAFTTWMTAIITELSDYTATALTVTQQTDIENSDITHGPKVS
jgi:hypothetical protein